MYRWIRTVRIKAGRDVAAQEVCKAIVDLLNKKYPGHAYEAHVEVFGAGSTIHFTAVFANLAARETMTDQVATDAEYQALSQKGSDTAIEGSTHDTLMRSI
jgi:hypothetical protein